MEKTNEELQLRIRELEKEIAKLHTQIKKERYGLVWLDVPEGFEQESENQIPVLEEVKDKAIKNDDGKPTHIIIEGDNYHALTCLNYTHKGKIDVIYIDPPYNTGSDGFTYKDKRFLKEFPDGSPVPKDHPLRHSYWLSFMSKRLELAKNLLSDKGVIFISIDDNEQANLKLLCDKIFIEDNTEQYIWCLQDKTEGSFVKTAGLTVRKEHEYIIACFKQSGKRYNKYKGERVFSDGSYTNPDNDPRGPWFSGNISRNGITTTTGSKYYTIVNPAGISFTRNWTLSKEEYETALKENRIYFANNGSGVPRLKIFQNSNTELIQSSLFNDVHTSITGKNELNDLFEVQPFNFPKPTTLIKRLMTIASKKSSIILDFFAGSGTTLHATMKLNAEDGGNRQCILVQQKEGDKNICESVTYERNKRVINGYTNAKGETVEGLGNSLKYYRTAFVGKNPPRRATDYDKTELSKKAGCLLALAENTLEEIEASNSYQIFSDGKNHYTGVYFTGRLTEIETFTQKLEVIRNQNRRIKITAYFFCWGDCAQFEDEFSNLERISLQPIPKPILDIYQSINR